MNSQAPVDVPMDSPPPGPLQLCLGAGFRFPVFISWPHLIQSRGEEIVRAFSKALENRFRDDGGASVFLDVDRIKPGYVWDETLRASLCRSAVTIVFLVRSYFESEFCRLEWGISQSLSALRLSSEPQLSSIIPILLARNLPLPREVNRIQFDKDFQELLVYGRDVTTHENWNRIVNDVADQVYALIERVCQTERDWTSEERLAHEANPMRFTWVQSAGSGAPQPKARFPRVSVEKPAA